MNDKNSIFTPFRLITIAVLIILVIVSLFRTGYLQDLGNDNEDNKSSKGTVSANPIESTAIKEDLAAKVKIINLTHGDTTKVSGASVFYEKELYNNLDDARLLYGLIEYLYQTKDPDIIIPAPNDYQIYEEYPNLIGYIDANKLKEKSLLYLGKDLTNLEKAPTDDDEYGTAWIAINKEDNTFYISSLGGGPMPSDMAFIYIYKYERTNTQAFVYVSATYGALTETGSVIYRGINSKIVYQAFTEDEIEGYLNFQISEQNSQEFTKYKYIFDSKDGNYYFNKIEKVE